MAWPLAVNFLKQHLKEQEGCSCPIVHGSLRIEPTRRIVTLDGEEIELTPREFDLLVLFTSHPGRAFSREFLLEHIWGYQYDGFDRTVDSHNMRQRKNWAF